MLQNDRDSDNSQGSLDPDSITGPITRQKQQLLQEQERKEKKSKDVTDKQQPVNIKTEDGEKRIAQYPHDRTFRRGSDERYQQSPTMSSSSNHMPPRLTLQSLTNMEDPFSNISASQFRPPYLRHTGLLSISHEHGSVPSHARPNHRTMTQPIRPEPLRSTGISFSEQETRDYLSKHSTSIQGRQFGPLPLSEQLGSRNKQEDTTTKVNFVPFSSLYNCKDHIHLENVPTVLNKESVNHNVNTTFQLIRSCASINLWILN